MDTKSNSLVPQKHAAYCSFVANNYYMPYSGKDEVRLDNLVVHTILFIITGLLVRNTSFLQDQTMRLWNIEGADRIPQVIENRRALGLKITQVCLTTLCLIVH